MEISVIPAFTLFFGMLGLQGSDNILWVVHQDGKTGWESFMTQHLLQGLKGIFRDKKRVVMPSLNEGLFCLFNQSCRTPVLKRPLEVTIEIYGQTLSFEWMWTQGLGRLRLALDPAPLYIFENTKNYRSEYILMKPAAGCNIKVDKR